MVVAQKVRPGSELEYERWQAEINAAAREFDGFERAEMIPPTTGVQDDHVVVFRFDTVEHLHAWLESDRRAEVMARGAHLFIEEPTLHQVTTPRSGTVTVVVTHRVKDGQQDAYRRWQKGIDAAVSRFRGFVSTEVFEPRAGQPDWVVVFRFDNNDNLQRWFDSRERADWLARAEPLLESVKLHKVHGGLGGWFQLHPQGGGARVAPAWKQAMTVLLALYPTLMILLMVLSPQLAKLDLPVAVQMLISNVVSIALLTWLVMPASTRVLRPWLDPRADPRTTAIGAAALFAVYTAMTVVFWLATR